MSQELREELQRQAARQRRQLIRKGAELPEASEKTDTPTAEGPERAHKAERPCHGYWVATIEAPTDAQLAWAAGLFVGEGYCGLLHRGRYSYVTISVQMLDERAVARFAALFARKVRFWPLHYDKARLVFRADASGKAAERILAMMWPHLLGTSKGDQVRRVCEEAGVMGWVDGTATTKRPLRRGGDELRGRRLSEETKQRIADSQRRRWDLKRASGA